MTQPIVFYSRAAVSLAGRSLLDWLDTRQGSGGQSE